jgi:hydrogenase maturation factor
MCFGIPAQLVEVYQKDDLPMGKGGLRRRGQGCLAYTPEAQPGMFALSWAWKAIEG